MATDWTIGAKVALDDSAYRQTLMQMGDMTKSILGKVAGFAGAYMGVIGLKSAVEGSVKAFMVQEDAVDDLEDALHIKGADQFSEKLQQVASDLQLVTTYGDEATMATMALGINMGIPAAKMEDATKAAMGLAAAYNIDLNTAMQLIAKANAGQTGTLSRYGIVLDQTKSKEEQFAELLQRGKDAFPLAEADTLSGKLQQLQNVWGDLMEVVGEFIVELFDVGNTSEGVTQMVSDATAYIKQNLQEWVFEIKYVYAYIEAGIKAVWAIFEPAVTYLWQCFKAGISNIVAIAQWGFENAGKIWENLPDIFVGIGKDILQYWKNIFNGLLNLAINLGKAIWTAIKGGGIEGFKKTFDQLCADAVKTVADSGKYSEEALVRAGVSAFPKLQTGDFGGMVDKYRKIGDTFAQIDADRAAKQARLEEDYARKLERSRAPKGKPGQQPGGAGKESVAGSFSAAMLNAMLGAGSPEKETAKNTKEMVRLQREQLKKSGTATADTYK